MVFPQKKKKGTKKRATFFEEEKNENTGVPFYILDWTRFLLQVRSVQVRSLVL